MQPSSPTSARWPSLPSTSPDPFEQRLALIEAEYRASLAAPLSARKVLLVAVLLDHCADQFFAARRTRPDTVFGAEDPLRFRAELARRSPAMAAVFALGNQSATLRLDSVTVPIADYPRLGIEDFMVSLYNQNTVQRVMLARSDFGLIEAHSVLAEALQFWSDYLAG